MYIPFFQLNHSRVPILSYDQIDEMAESFIEDFQPDVFAQPEAIDIEGFVECYLGMTPDYQYLSHNGIYLGMTVFNATDKIPVYDPIRNRAEYISASAHTVIIDRSVLEDVKQEHRYRFTVGHEAGHDIFHQQYFKIDLGPLSLLKINIETEPLVLCRKDSIHIRKKNTETWGDHEWLEWQANCFSSCILMPRKAVVKTVNSVGIKEAVLKVSEVFNVSEEAAKYRLIGLKYISE